MKNLPTILYKIIRWVYRSFRYGQYRLDMAAFPGKMKRYCPCCGLRFRGFKAGRYQDLADKVDVKRYEKNDQHVLCPYCASLPRHRILAVWCGKHIRLLQSSRILYFAPEKSMMRWMDRKHIDVITADLYQPADLKLDIQDTRLPSSSFDVIFCNHVLEHVDDFRKALKEVHRILMDKGVLICSFPIDSSIDLVYEDQSIISPEERKIHFGQYDHKRLFGKRANELLIEAGFNVKRIEGSCCPDIILPVTGPADYDSNTLFCCVKG